MKALSSPPAPSVVARQTLLPAVLFLFLVLAVLAPASALAASRCDGGGSWVLEEYQVAQPDGQADPPVTDGWSVYWADDRTGDFDVYMQDQDNGESVAADGPGDQTAPAVGDGEFYWLDSSLGDSAVMGTGGTGSSLLLDPGPSDAVVGDGQYAVWTDTTNGAENADLMAMDLTTGERFVVSNAAGSQSDPSLSNGVVVWDDTRNDDWDVYGYDLATRTEFPIATGDGDQMNPDIFAGVVVWEDTRNGNADIYGSYLWNGEGSGDDAAAALTGRLGCGQVDVAGEPFAVCTAPGDQVTPAVGGAMVVWEDQRCGEDNADIGGYDLIDGHGFLVCDAEGPQTAPDVADGLVTWLDGRDDPSQPAVYAATWAPGGDPQDPEVTDPWTNSDFVTLFLSVFNDLGLFSDVRFAVNDGPWGDWQSFDDIEQLQLPGKDGVKVIHVQFRDEDGNPTPPVAITVTLDTAGPTTVAAAPAAVAAGAKANVKYEVRDRLSPKAKVRLVVTNGHGKVVKTVRLGVRPTNKSLVASFTCGLPKGTYRFTVRAVDLAGNRQARAGSNKLIVR